MTAVHKILFICLFGFTTPSILLTSARADGAQERKPTAIVSQGGGYWGGGDLSDFIKENDKMWWTEDAEVKVDEEIQIPIEINNRVASWIRYLTIKNRAGTARMFRRGSRYKVHIERMLEEHGVPKEIFYIALIESGFIPNARSKAQAVGLWQMIRGTGANYGLKINHYVDERQHWIKSTESAITYLKDLKNVFGSWYLAFAAYNAGEYQIVRSIINGKSRDFWVLAEGKFLPEETLHYVPKFMAAMTIGRNPEKYNIKFEEDKPWDEFETVMVPSGVSLKRLSKITKVPRKIINEWNPDILRGVVPWGESGRFEMYFPKLFAKKVKAKDRALAKTKDKNQKVRRYAKKGKNAGYAVYVVKPGDTLIGISRILGMQVRTLKKINRIRRSYIRVGQRLKYYVNLSKAISPTGRTIASTPTSAPSNGANRPGHHIVQKGQSLYLIASHYDVTVDELVDWNSLESLDLEPGQELIVSK